MGFESPIVAEWEKSGDYQVCGVEKKYLIIDVNGIAELITLEKISNQFSFSGFLNERSSTKIISIIGSVNFTINEILDL